MVGAVFVRSQWTLPDQQFPVDLLRLALFGLSRPCRLLPSSPGVWQYAGLAFACSSSPTTTTDSTNAPTPGTGAADGMLGTAPLTEQTLGAVILVSISNLASVTTASVRSWH